MTKLRSSLTFGEFRSAKSQWDWIAAAIYVLLVFAFAFGGASRLNSVRLAFVELVALPLLVLATPPFAANARQLWRDHSYFLLILAGILLLPVIQLLPLPTVVATNLAGREAVRLALEVTEISPATGVISLTPDLTRDAFLALMPPLAMTMGLIVARTRTRAGPIVTMLALSAVSILLGAAQLMSGNGSLYPWPTTDVGSMSGLLANRNHLATLCLLTLPFALVLAAGALRKRGGDQTSSDKVLFWACLGYAGLSVVAIAATMSRAGLLLLGPTLVVSLLATWVASGRRRPRSAMLGLAGSVGTVFAVVVALAIDPILARFTSSGVEGRLQAWPEVAEAAQAYLPLGSGIGSFDAVYRSIEPIDRLGPLYFNHAHNEYLEVWLETGWLGIGIFLAFLVWFGRRSWAVWRAPVGQINDLRRAASIAIVVILLHSVGDYPLRTETIAVIFALCCGFLELVRSESVLLPSNASTPPRARNR